MLNGWIKLHRSLLDHWVSSEPDSLAVWIRMLSEANHKETKKRFNGSLVTIGRGQLVFGLNAFSDKSGVSISKLRRVISELEADGMISRQKTSKYSLITITCFDKYQSDDSQTASKSQADNKQTASKSQHRKNVKNVKNEEEEREGAKASRSKKFIKPTIEEIHTYMQERNHDSRDEAERFFDYWESVGWVRNKTPMKDWRASVRTWLKNAKPVVSKSSKPDWARGML